jgi:hypothetical protein
MKYVIYNETTGVILRAKAQSVGMFITNYKSESAAKAALTRLIKKSARRVECNEIYKKLDAKHTGAYSAMMPAMIAAGMTKREAYNASSTGDIVIREDYKIDTAEDYRVAFPVKMVEKRNAMTGKTYMEADNTPRCCSPSSELYWSM